MALTRTFSIIKPDATNRNLTGRINAKLEEAGLRIVERHEAPWFALSAYAGLQRARYALRVVAKAARRMGWRSAAPDEQPRVHLLDTTAATEQPVAGADQSLRTELVDRLERGARDLLERGATLSAPSSGQSISSELEQKLRELGYLDD